MHVAISRPTSSLLFPADKTLHVVRHVDSPVDLFNSSFIDRYVVCDIRTF